MIEFAWTKGNTLLPWIWNSLFSYFWDIILSSEYRTLNTMNISLFDMILFWYLFFLLPIQLFLHTLMYAECIWPTLSFLSFLKDLYRRLLFSLYRDMLSFCYTTICTFIDLSKVTIMTENQHFDIIHIHWYLILFNWLCPAHGISTHEVSWLNRTVIFFLYILGLMNTEYYRSFVC